MHENDRFDGCSDEIDRSVEREATLRLLMEFVFNATLLVYYSRIPSLFLEIFGVNCARFNIHNWVHNAELQPEAGRRPDYVAADETAIRFNNE